MSHVSPFSTRLARVKVRKPPHEAHLVLDLPDFSRDPHLNLIDWSVTNQIAVSLGGCEAYLYEVETKETQPLGRDR